MNNLEGICPIYGKQENWAIHLGMEEQMISGKGLWTIYLRILMQK
jgi:hypothetical protein